jgi:predicted signal transduction protein with EAL and GGDEF domain
VWKDKIFNIGVSVGLIEISRESGAPEEVMSAADSACYVAKRQGNHVHVYSARDEAVARHRGEIQWLQRLQSALKENRFELMAQTIVATTMEATATAAPRWKSCCDCRMTAYPAVSRQPSSCAPPSAIG